MARYKFQGRARDTWGNIVSGLSIYIYISGTSKSQAAMVYSTRTASTGTSAAPQITSNQYGLFQFWVDDTDYTASTTKFDIIAASIEYDYLDIYNIKHHGTMGGLTPDDHVRYPTASAAEVITGDWRITGDWVFTTPPCGYTTSAGDGLIESPAGVLNVNPNTASIEVSNDEVALASTITTAHNFSLPVSGVTPSASNHLATMLYVDTSSTFLDGAIPGIAVANKAVVLDSNKSITSITNLTIGTSAASASVPTRSEVMKWKGIWIPGTYEKGDVVSDDRWSMVALRETDERAAPQPVGESDWIMDQFAPSGSSFTTEVTGASTLYVGQRYEFDPAFVVKSARVWLPSASSGLECEIWAIRDPLGDPRLSNIKAGFEIELAETDQWVELNIDSQFITLGTVIDVIMIFKSNVGSTNFTYAWNYISSNGVPVAGEIKHQKGNNIDTILVHEQDNGLVDRTSDLDNLSPGSTIYMASSEYTWDILEISKIGDVYYLTVDPGASAKSSLSNFTFTYFAVASIPYVIINDLYVSESRISGYFDNSYVGATGWINNNGYGIDLKIQKTTSSDDWDVISQG